LNGFFTEIGNTFQATLIIGVISLIIFLLRFGWEAVVGVIRAYLAFLTNTVIKILLHRLRPAVDVVNVFKHHNDYSFPSGHVVLYVSYFGFMFF